MLVRLATRCSWQDAERLCGNKVSDTTVRHRRDMWIPAGVFDGIANEAIPAYDRVIGLDLSDVAVDGSLHKSPCGGEGTGKKPDRSGQDDPTGAGHPPEEVPEHPAVLPHQHRD